VKHSVVFITGTDTDAGKTYVSCALLQGLQQLARRSIGIKPFAAGVNQAGLNTDALALQANNAVAMPYPHVNRLCLAEPIAPHLAAAHQELVLTEDFLQQAVAAAANYQPDVLLVEGAGGWLLPMNDNEYLSDWVTAAHWPVVLVVGMKLGCLNHALLTMAALQQAKVPVLGWVANCIDPQMLCLEENIQSLKQRLKPPLLAICPYQPEGPFQAQSVGLAQALLQQLKAEFSF